MTYSLFLLDLVTGLVYNVSGSSGTILENGTYYISSRKNITVKVEVYGKDVHLYMVTFKGTLNLTSLSNSTENKTVAFIEMEATSFERGKISDITLVGANTLNSQNVSIRMQIDDEIVNVTITGPQFLSPNETYQFAANGTGTSVSYQWDINGSSVDFQLENRMIHTFRSIQSAKIKVTASNIHGQVNDTMVVQVIYPLVDFFLKCPLVVKLGKAFMLQYGFATGSLVDLEILDVDSPIKTQLSGQDILKNESIIVSSANVKTVTIQVSNPITPLIQKICIITNATLNVQNFTNPISVGTTLEVVLKYHNVLDITAYVLVSNDSNVEEFGLKSTNPCSNPCLEFKANITFIYSGVYYLNARLRNDDREYHTPKTTVLVVNEGETLTATFYTKSVKLGSASTFYILIPLLLLNATCEIDFKDGSNSKFVMHSEKQNITKIYGTLGDYAATLRCDTDLGPAIT